MNDFNTININGVDVLLGTIKADKIQAGTIEDADGSLMAMTNQFLSELNGTNKNRKNERIVERIKNILF
jgi:hypothetical protein